MKKIGIKILLRWLLVIPIFIGVFIGFRLLYTAIIPLLEWWSGDDTLWGSGALLRYLVGPSAASSMAIIAAFLAAPEKKKTVAMILWGAVIVIQLFFIWTFLVSGKPNMEIVLSCSGAIIAIGVSGYVAFVECSEIIEDVNKKRL